MATRRASRAALDRMGDVDELICAGDVVEEYRFDNEAVAMLRDRDARCVLGNHDIGLLGAARRAGPSGRHVDQRLVAWLGRPPAHDRHRRSHGKRLVITHASPCAPHTQYVMPHSPELKRIGEVDADVVIIGHTHRQMVERVGRPCWWSIPDRSGQARDPRNGRRCRTPCST